MRLKYKTSYNIIMFLCVNDNTYKSDSVIFSQKIKNNILSNGYFYKIYYSDEYFTSNGLLLLFDIKELIVENYFNRVKCSFCKTLNKDILSFIKKLEYKILADFNFENLYRPVYRIDEQLKNEYIKIFSDKKIQRGKLDKLQVLLKISGVWADDEACGITFRFLVNHQ